MEITNQMKVTVETSFFHCHGTSKRLTQRKHSPCSIFLHETSHWSQFRWISTDVAVVSHRGSPEQKALGVLWALNRGGERGGGPRSGKLLGTEFE